MKWYPAPGKLNLFLHILGNRADGYHELQTVFRLVDRADRVGIRIRPDGAIGFTGVYGEDNLCVRAARLLQSETDTRFGADLELEKNLPVGGGMGGGSSDAATVLLVLNKLWKVHLDRLALISLGAKLGADVPVFVNGVNALGEGIGERLTALDLPCAWYLVLEPQVSVSTREIFGSALTGRSKALKIPPFFRGQGANDLEAAAVSLYPDIASHLEWLRQRCAPARMTGSGACVFAEFGSEAEALAVLDELPKGMRGFVARGLDRHPLREWTY